MITGAAIKNHPLIAVASTSKNEPMNNAQTNAKNQRMDLLIDTIQSFEYQAGQVARPVGWVKITCRACPGWIAAL